MEPAQVFTDLFHSLWLLVVGVAAFAVQLLLVGLHYFLFVLYLAWALFAINWKRLWPTLAAGAWAPLVLLVLLSALVWNYLEPIGPYGYWWYLGGVSLIAGGALFCGWLQGVLGWAPPDLSFEPPAQEAHHGHHHHGHH